MDISTVGLNLAKNVFQVHAIDSAGKVIVRRSLRRRQVMPFFTKLEPCGTSHFWGRELQALGHEVKLMPPIYVTPYVKRGKTDAGDAAAICEAVTRPGAQATATASISTFHPGRTRPATTMVVDAALWSAPRCSLRAAASSGT